MLDTIKVIHQSLRDGRIGNHQIDNRFIKWVGFILWVPVALVLYSVFMVIFWVVYVLFIMPAMILELYVFTRKEAKFDESGIQFTKAYGRCVIPWSEVREVIYKREHTAFYYRVIRVAPSPTEKSLEYIIASTPDNSRFEDKLKGLGITFSKRDWMDRVIDDEPTGPDN
jgi:hypothetical protein